MDGIKNLTLSSQPLELPSPISAACIEEPPLDSVLEPIVVEVYSLSSPHGSIDSGYFLCSCTKGSSEGLGKATVETPRGRGRISHFAKAQTKTRKDLLDGKKLSIEKALRVVHSQKKGKR